AVLINEAPRPLGCPGPGHLRDLPCSSASTRLQRQHARPCRASPAYPRRARFPIGSSAKTHYLDTTRVPPCRHPTPIDGRVGREFFYPSFSSSDGQSVGIDRASALTGGFAFQKHPAPLCVATGVSDRMRGTTSLWLARCRRPSRTP